MCVCVIFTLTLSYVCVSSVFDPVPNFTSTDFFVVVFSIQTVRLYISLDIHMSFCTLTLSYFCVSWMFNPVPNFTKQNPMVIDHYPYHWRASGASETLSGVTQLKIGDICLFMCVDVHMSFCTLTLVYFCVNSVCDPVPNFTKQFLLIYRSLPVSP